MLSIIKLYSILIAVSLTYHMASAQDSNELKKVSAATFMQWQQELSNWGRWGEDDQLGTINLITGEKKVQAAALVKQGTAVSLANNLSKEKTQNNPEPLVHQASTIGPWAFDIYTTNYHGYAHSHMDALCHMAHEGKMYNGYSQEIGETTGSSKLGVEHLSQGIFSRGILVDIPWVRGVPYLEPGTPIYSEDLEDWERKSGITISSGDVLLLRTGRWAYEQQKGPGLAHQKLSGIHASTAKWLKARDIAVLGSDGGSDVLPSGVEGQTHPIHMLFIIYMGTPILDNLNLEELSQQALLLNRWEFLFTAAPLRVEGGTGSPLNPLAVF